MKFPDVEKKETKKATLTSSRKLLGVDDLGGELETSRFLNASSHNRESSPKQRKELKESLVQSLDRVLSSYHYYLFAFFYENPRE